MSKKRFHEHFLKAVDFTFDSLGKSCKQALYFHLKNSFNVERKDVSEKVEDFDRALTLIFGDGIVYLRKSVLRKLCEDLGVEFEESYVDDFAGTVSKLKSMTSEDESLVTISGFDEEEVSIEKRRGGERVVSKS